MYTEAAGGGGLSGGVIAGMVIGILLFVVLVVVAVCCFFKWRNRKQELKEEVANKAGMDSMVESVCAAYPSVTVS